MQPKAPAPEPVLLPPVLSAGAEGVVEGGTVVLPLASAPLPI